jgi:hypothetical protein
MIRAGNAKYRSLLSYAAVAFLALANLSMDWEHHDWLLTGEDIFLEENQNSRAVGSALNEAPQWESFNEWHCYSVAQIELSYADAIWDERQPEVKERMPVIVTLDGKMSFDYEDIHFTREKYENVISAWQRLIEGQQSICIYAAYLQETGEETSAWVLSGIKTSNGYWPKDKSVFFNTSSEHLGGEEKDRF